ncbi:MAG: hypothetical protein AABX38_07160 [Candidatus Micrarchaeota archaeon]
MAIHRSDKDNGSVPSALAKGQIEKGGKSAIVRLRNELSASRDLLIEESANLSGRINESRKALNESQERLDLIKSKKDMEAKLATLKEKQRQLSERINEIYSGIAEAFGIINIFKCVADGRVDLIIQSGKEDIIKAIQMINSALAGHMYAGGDYEIKNLNGDIRFIRGGILTNYCTLLQNALSQASNSESKQAALQRKLREHSTYLSLFAEFESVKREGLEIESKLAAFTTYALEWQRITGVDKTEKTFSLIERITKAGGIVAAFAAIPAAFLGSIELGATIAAAAGLVPLATKLSIKSLRPNPNLLLEETELALRSISEKQVKELREAIKDLSEQKRAQVEALISEERSLRELSDGKAE